MEIEAAIEAIREGIKAGRFVNEASVSQGIVMRLLDALGWPQYDTRIVCPQYSLSGRRVDFALCHPPEKPVAIIEVKQIGQSDGAERQLFEYAFHDGVPLAILTDGREWNFFLPAEQGDYGERRVYKLDILDRDLKECGTRLQRYLRYADVASGAAMDAARADYRDVTKSRQIIETLPKAWRQIIEDEDEMVLEILADRVETLCGFKPPPDSVAQFLKELYFPKVSSGNDALRRVGNKPESKPSPKLEPRSEGSERTNARQSPAQIGFTVANKSYSAKNAIEVLKKAFEQLSLLDPTFLDRFADLPEHGRKRRFLARNPNDLYPGNPDLCLERSVELKPGFWLGTNHSRESIKNILSLAKRTALSAKGGDLTFNLG